jgi:hypothetical protein
MGDRHLSLETMAKWLTGRLKHDDLLQEVVPHHLEQCPGCRQAYETLETMKQEVGHWDEEVALLESREAPELAALLDQKVPEERAGLIEEEESLHTWGLCQLLLRRSLAAARQDPGSGSLGRTSLLCAEPCKPSSLTTVLAKGFCLRRFAAGSAVRSAPRRLHRFL